MQLQLLSSWRATGTAMLVATLVAAHAADNAPATSRASDVPAPGAQVSYVDEAGHSWCATIEALDIGADDRRWAWLTIDSDRRRVAHAPVGDLQGAQASCSPRAHRGMVGETGRSALRHSATGR